MINLSKEIIYFFQNQEFAIVSSLDKSGCIHCSAKGIAEIEPEGKVYLIDLYHAHTFRNLKNNPTVSITAINSHQFIGYTLKGKANIIERKQIASHIIEKWKEKLIQRISKRVIKNIKVDKSGSHQPEVNFPNPKHLIVATIESIVDLAPAHLKQNF